MAQNQIPYRIIHISIDHFEMCPQQLDDKFELDVNTNFSFQANFENHCIRCINEYTFTRNNEKLANLRLICIFEVEPTAFESMYDETREHLTVSKYFCQYMGTIAVGAARGVLVSEFKNTPFANIVLPPINLVEMMTTDSVFTVK